MRVHKSGTYHRVLNYELKGPQYHKSEQSGTSRSHFPLPLRSIRSMFNVVTDDVSRRKSSFGANAERASSGLQVDTEQVESFEKIRELLVAGGYFRAMIKTLVRVT